MTRSTAVVTAGVSSSWDRVSHQGPFWRRGGSAALTPSRQRCRLWLLVPCAAAMEKLPEERPQRDRGGRDRRPWDASPTFISCRTPSTLEHLHLWDGSPVPVGLQQRLVCEGEPSAGLSHQIAQLEAACQERVRAARIQRWDECANR